MRTILLSIRARLRRKPRTSYAVRVITGVRL